MEVFDQNRKHVEARNQRINTPADVTVGYWKSGTWEPELGTWDQYVGPGTRDLGSGTLHLGPKTQDLGPIRGTRDQGPLRGTRDLEPSIWDPFWNIHTHTLAICHMKDYVERNNFDLRSTFWKWLLHVLNCVWKVRHKNVTFKREKLYEKVIH